MSSLTQLTTESLGWIEGVIAATPFSRSGRTAPQCWLHAFADGNG